MAVSAAFVLVAALSWVILQGAGHRPAPDQAEPRPAPRRTLGDHRLVWTASRDTSTLMAAIAIAIALTVVGWLIIPLGLLLEFTLF